MKNTFTVIIFLISCMGMINVYGMQGERKQPMQQPLAILSEQIQQIDSTLNASQFKEQMKSIKQKLESMPADIQTIIKDKLLYSKEYEAIFEKLLPIRVTSLIGQKATISSVALTSDGKKALTGSYDGTARLWFLDEAITEKVPFVTLSNRPVTESIALAADGKRAVLAGSHNAKFWFLDKATPEEEMPPFVSLNIPGKFIDKVVLTPDGKRALLGVSNGAALIIWFLDKAVPQGEVPPYTVIDNQEGLYTFALSSDGKRALTGTTKGIARLWFLDEAKPGEVPPFITLGNLDNIVSEVLTPGVGWRKTGEAIVSVALTPDGKRALIGYDNGIVRLWFLDEAAPGGKEPPFITLSSNMERMHSVELSRKGMRLVALTSDGKKAIIGFADGTIKVWLLDKAIPGGVPPVITLKGHQEGITSIALTPDGKRLLTGSWDKTARMWFLDKAVPGKDLLSSIVLSGHKGAVMTVALTPDGRTALTGSVDGTAKVWFFPPFSLWEVILVIVRNRFSGTLDETVKNSFDEEFKSPGIRKEIQQLQWN